MTTAKPKPDKISKDTDRIANDFSMTVATMNGSGSQTSNVTLLRSMFKMGIPVSGKNLFPSNIQGLPTWYTIRVSKDGYIARRETHEIVVAMNDVTFVDDYEKVVPGGAFYYADHLKYNMNRDDISHYAIPAKELAKNSGAPSSLRDYVANMAYVGVLVHMLGIDMKKVEQALDFHFKGKEKPIALNMNVITAAIEWAKENLEKDDPYVVEPMDGTDGLIMADGNTAGALGSIYGGVQFLSWYPITPATSLAEGIHNNIDALRTDVDKHGGKTYAIVQAEDELAAVGMAVGAGWGGLRAMTSTSGPGLGLMTEFVGLAYYAEIPIVIWDITRVGPSTGLPTRTSQGDLLMLSFLGHGDTEHIILIPGTANECFEYGWRSFDIAERVQTPVFVMSDLDLGMNQWMTEPFEYPNTPMDRGKIVWEKELKDWKERFGRYVDVDGDGIPYRTAPGNKDPRSAWFARGTGHDEYANYSEDSPTFERNMERLVKKFKTARQYTPKPEKIGSGKNKVGIIAFGSTRAAILEAQDRLEAEGLKTDFMRLKALPPHESVREFIEKHENTFIVELNRDGQMLTILEMNYPDLSNKMTSVTKHDGLPLTARLVTEAILDKEQK